MICNKCRRTIPDGSVYCNLCGKKQVITRKKRLKRANGTGSISKLSGKRTRPYMAKLNGVIIGYYKTVNEASDALDRVCKLSVSDRYTMTLAQVHELWKSEHFRELTPKGQEMYITAYKHIQPLYDRKMKDLRTEDYQRCIDDLINKGRSFSTTAKVKQICSQLCKWAMREDIITKNYAEYIKLQADTKKEKKIFSESDIQILFDNSSDETVKIILILIFTGMRIGELFNLPRSQVFLDKGYMRGGNKTEAGKDRLIPIASCIYNYVDYFYKRSFGEECLLDGMSANRAIKNFRERDFYPALLRLNIDKHKGEHTPHSCRHTFASIMARSGVRPDVLKKIIGHSDYLTTEKIYIHSEADELKAAVDNMYNFMPKL